MAKKIIIGIHGLGNKPPRRLLRYWWRQAISEGLAQIGHPNEWFDFELVYWASFVNSEPLDAKIKDKDHPLYIENPYVPAKPAHNKKHASKLRKLYLNVVEKVLDALFLSEHWWFNFDSISDRIIRKKFQELNIYYHKDNRGKFKIGLRARAVIREALAKVLRKHRKRTILLLAHSMGSIIAYDVLTQEVPDVEIHSFVTMGSPLGLPAVKKRILLEQHKSLKKEKEAPTPENIRKAWYNFSDLDDQVALNYGLADDYKKNSRGIGPTDVVVYNDYEYEGQANHHKSYGYLRTPEVAKVIYDFLHESRFAPFNFVRKHIDRLVKKIGG